eukprot:7573770-Pyramimonas_sp.AAC.1
MYHKHRRMRRVADLPAMAMAPGRSWAAPTTRPSITKTKVRPERFKDIARIFSTSDSCGSQQNVAM